MPIQCYHSLPSVALKLKYARGDRQARIPRTSATLQVLDMYAFFELSPFPVDNAGDKQPLDMPQARSYAGFDSLPIPTAKIYAIRIKHLQRRDVHGQIYFDTFLPNMF